MTPTSLASSGGLVSMRTFWIGPSPWVGKPADITGSTGLREDPQAAGAEMPKPSRVAASTVADGAAASGPPQRLSGEALDHHCQAEGHDR